MLRSKMIIQCNRFECLYCKVFLYNYNSYSGSRIAKICFYSKIMPYQIDFLVYDRKMLDWTNSPHLLHRLMAQCQVCSTCFSFESCVYTYRGIFVSILLQVLFDIWWNYRLSIILYCINTFRTQKSKPCMVISSYFFNKSSRVSLNSSLIK